MKDFTARRASPLLEALFEALDGSMSRSAVRRLLSHGRVAVNGEAADHTTLLRPGDRVGFGGRAGAPPARGVRIVHEDAAVVVIDKPPGLLTIATEKEKSRTAYRALNDHLGRRGRAFIVHRLDREASGLLVFAKNPAAKRSLQARWPEAVKEYFALVEGAPDPAHGRIEEDLRELKTGKVAVVAPGEGYASSTRYETLERRRRFSLLRVTLETGRKHQVRAHLAHIGHPIAGDRAYGASGDPIGRLGLHACRLEFPHPVSGERFAFESPLPRGFAAALGDARRA